MKVSVIITSYKYGKFLKEAIDSALRQEFGPEGFEVVVVYRESGDETEKVLAGYKGKVSVIKQTGKGLANAGNLGIAAAKGKYLVRLDADDRFYPDILKREAEVLNNNPEVDFVYPDYDFLLDEKGKKVRKHLPEFNKEEMVGRGDFLSGGTMFRRSLFDRVGKYDESLPTLESYEFILRLMKNNIIGRHLPVPLFEYRIHDKSMSQDRELVEKTGRRIAARYEVEYRIGESHPRRINNE